MTNKNIHIFYVEIWGGDISTYRIMFICRIRLSFIKLVDVWRFVRPVGLQLIKTSWYFCSWWTTVVTNNDGQRRVNTISLIAPRHTKSDRKREREREREGERERPSAKATVMYLKWKMYSVFYCWDKAGLFKTNTGSFTSSSLRCLIFLGCIIIMNMVALLLDYLVLWRCSMVRSVYSESCPLEISAAAHSCNSLSDFH